jgi:AcrR family transcriptional regulator
MTSSSRDRLVHAARTLFAERGFAATTVGDIEERAGFTRRGGTLYRHFASKDEILDAVIDTHVAAADASRSISALLPLQDRRSELTLIARLLLAELDREEAIHRILDKDGAAVDRARKRMTVGVLHAGYRHLVELFRPWLPDDLDRAEAEALVVVALGGLVNLRRNRWTFGAVPLDVDDERAIRAWVTLVDAALHTLAGGVRPRGAAVDSSL